MQRLQVSSVVRLIYRSLGIKGLNKKSDGSPKRSGRLGDQKYRLPLPGMEPGFLDVQPVA